MKAITPHRRTTVRAIRPHRPHRQTYHGNGHARATTSEPTLRADLTSWLRKPKHNLIGGKWVPAASGKTFEVLNPADATLLTQVPDSEQEDINRAVAAARRAF
jgi:hypothetical protein